MNDNSWLTSCRLEVRFAETTAKMERPSGWFMHQDLKLTNIKDSRIFYFKPIGVLLFCQTKTKLYAPSF
jgi:hypothetical protein